MDLLPPGLVAFALTCLLIELTPGPNMTWLALLGLQKGRGAGFAAVGGVALGLALVGVAAALGVSELIAASPAVFQALKWAGVGYFAFLAWEAWRDDGTAPVRAAPQNGRYFRRGLITNILNPKAVIFYVAVLPRFIDAALPPGRQALILSGVYLLVATVVHAGIVTLAGGLRPMLGDPRVMRIAGKGFALALAGVGVWIALAT